MNDIVIKIGELLVRAGIVTGVDLSEAEKLAKHMNLQFGQVLIMSGCLSEHDLDCALVAQQLIREELLTVDIACQALAVASQHQMPFEDALEALSVVPKYGAASVEMAELLADAGIIPGELLEQALMTSLTGNVSLGELLVRENAISSALVPALNMMLADIGSGVLEEEHAINEIRKHHISWQRAQAGFNNEPMTQSPARQTEGPAPAPVFVSQELMHAYEIYQPQQHVEPQNPPAHQHPPHAQPQPQQHLVSPTNSYVEITPTPAPAPAPSPAPAHSIHDVLSMFQQRNPVASPPEGSTAVPREQQAASWTAFVQSQSFDPNDVEPSVPPMAVAEEPRLRNLEEPSRPLEVVQGTYAKTFDGKSTENLPETFEPVVPPDFEPAAEVIADVPVKAEAGQKLDSTAAAPADDDKEEPGEEQFSLLVELLIESTHFDREDIIEAITNALKEESKAVKLIEMLGLADARSIMAASICADALRKNELTSGEAVTVLGDIKAGAEIHEALESVNLELAVTVSANLQMMYDDEVDETFYVGDVSRTVDIFEVDDFIEESKTESKKVNTVDATPPLVVESNDETPPIAFGYGRERLKIAKRAEPPVEERPAPTPVAQPVPAPVPVTATAPERPQTTIGGKKVSSLSEVFEKLSGVENNGATAMPAVAETGASPSTAAPTVRSSNQTGGNAPAANSDNSAHGAEPPSSTNSRTFAEEPIPAPKITPAVDSIPAPKITPAVDSIPAPKITIVEPIPASTALQPDAAPASDTSTSDDDKKAARKKHSTTFNSLQAVFVPGAEPLVTDAGKKDAATEDVVSNEASSEYAAYVSNKASVVEDKHVEDVPDKVEDKCAEMSGTVEDKHAEKVSGTVEDKQAEKVSGKVEDKHAEEVSGKVDDKQAEEVSGKVEAKHAEAVSDKVEDKQPEEVADKIKDKHSEKVSDKVDQEPIDEVTEKTSEAESESTVEEVVADDTDEMAVASSSKKKPRSSKAKIRGGAKEKTAAAAPKKTKRRK